MWLLGGILLGGIVHLSVVLLLPRTATQDAYSRLQPITPMNKVVPLPLPNPDQATMPFMDPAFATAVCRNDLSQALSFYTRTGVAYYAINDRAAGRRVIELDLMTAKQKSELPEEEDVTAADRLIVESPTLTGLIELKALAPELGLMPLARGVLSVAQCRPQ
jgi:uncharacterized membrane protein